MQITTGRVKKPYNILVYGEPGSGKTSFAAGSDRPIFVASDETDEFDVARFSKVTKFSDAIAQLDFLINHTHDYKTVVVDTVDSLEMILRDEVLKEEPNAKKRTMNKANGGYGNSYDMVAIRMSELKEKLEILRDKKGMNIITLFHSKSQTKNDPIIGQEYKEIDLVSHDKVANIFSDWVSCILFLAVKVEKSDDDKFAYGTGERVLYTSKRVGFTAKNRYNLPAELDVPEKDPMKFFLDGYESYFNNTVKTTDIIDVIRKMSEGINDQELLGKIMESLEKNINNTTNLLKLKSRVEEIVGG